MTTASIRDVAAAAGVSVGTVSNVLNQPQIVAAKTVERVHTAITELNFVRNDAARQLRAGRSRTVGLIVLDVGNPFFADVARGAQDRASQDGLTVILGDSNHTATLESTYLDLFEEQRVQGVLISPIGDSTARLQQLRDRGIAAVLVDRLSPDSAFSSVSVDDIGGGQLAVEHLLSLGRRRVAFVGGPVSVRQVADRLQGANQAVDAASAGTLRHFPTSALSVLAGREAGEQILALPVAERPDGVFCANDLIALGVLQAFTSAGTIAVPDDIALVGYDDIDFAAAATVPLSSISQPSSLLGATAIALLIAEIDDPGTPREQVVFTPELRIRASTTLEE